MSTWVIHNPIDGSILGWHKHPFPGAVEIAENIVYVKDGIPYTSAPAPTLEDQLAAIEAKYAGKQAELDSALVNALWVGGPQEASIRGSLMTKRQKLIDDRDAEIAALFA